MNVQDIMTREVVSVAPATPLKEVARLLVERRISGLPVVDDGRIVGVVSEADFLAKEAGPLPAPGPAVLRRLLGETRADEERTARVEATTAGEAMTTPAVTIDGGESVVEAARRMGERGINRLPVVQSGRLIGIVTRADIVRSFVRRDDEIDADVRRALHAVDGLVVEGVHDGIVRLAGRVDHRVMAETARDLAARMPGVVAVDDRAVSWREPESVRA